MIPTLNTPMQGTNFFIKKSTIILIVDISYDDDITIIQGEDMDQFLIGMG